jgi:hypothetical protein
MIRLYLYLLVVVVTTCFALWLAEDGQDKP